ncbi:DUF4856 domain-containing protein [Cellulophaga sp. 20_2_10]|uniref:DUF4856 domain-containing protein n=1 Tax=Cellulophaga sp. 20_2_10 TaxID=2942476 RepID=UPI00201A7F50|nr:DUF4856 domain-containing protein [Cellulophaga sp. 20_2_10]MCL5246022.1 DUF4856 domain-containing protein [Cellulophaga sp. 20_2_10]
MKLNRVFVGLFVASAIFTSCSSDDNGDDTSGEKNVVAPATYVFENNGQSSVDFGGQTTRIQMGQEFISALKDNSKTEAELDAMFAHEEGAADFSDADLNSSGKSIRSKVAASADYFSANATASIAIKEQLDLWISEQVTDVFPNWDVDAVAGSAGKIQQAGGGSTRYVNGKGLEYNQAIAKSIIGGLMVDQMLNNYLSTAVLDEATNKADNDAGTLVDGKNYTNMEHKWDEAYGYLYGNEDTPATPELGKDSFLNEYLGKVEEDSDFAGIANDVYKAFKLGRAAIVAKDYTLRDKQVEIIRENISKVIAIRGVHYLQSGKENLVNDKASAFHGLSEAFGFVNSLRFTRDIITDSPILSSEKIDGFMDTLMADNGFWDVTPATLDMISDEISAAYGFTKEQAAN